MPLNGGDGFIALILGSRSQEDKRPRPYCSQESRERRGKRQGQNTGRCSCKKNFRKKVNLEAPVVHAPKRQESLRYLSGDIVDS